MSGKPSVLVDINVLLDVLQKREPFFEASAHLLALVESGKVRGFIASHSVPTLFYLIRKDKTSADARAIITSLVQFLEIAPVDQRTIEQALNLDYPDFEDAVQMISALQCKVDYLITRNVKDYHPPLLPVMQPIDFIALTGKQSR
jgi:predicted nucleic acid-binding protein